MGAYLNDDSSSIALSALYHSFLLYLLNHRFLEFFFFFILIFHVIVQEYTELLRYVTAVRLSIFLNFFVFQFDPHFISLPFSSIWDLEILLNFYVFIIIFSFEDSVFLCTFVECINWRF